MASDWNVLMDRLAKSKLAPADYRIVCAIARKTLGFRGAGKAQGDVLSASQIAETTGLGRQHVTSALVSLEARQIITREGGRVGKAATIALNLSGPWVRQPVPSTGHVDLSRPRDTLGAEIAPKPVPPTGHVGDSQPVPSARQEPVPSTGHTRGKGVKKGEESAFLRECFDAYLAGGGTLELKKERGSLARSAKALLDSGYDPDLIVAVFRDLGRKGEFPGYAKQRAAEFAANGLPCQWARSDMSQLTAEQLSECRCAKCVEWIEWNAKLAEKVEA